MMTSCSPFLSFLSVTGCQDNDIIGGQATSFYVGTNRSTMRAESLASYFSSPGESVLHVLSADCRSWRGELPMYLALIYTYLY